MASITVLSMATLCVSCGNEISNATDRRNICNKPGKAVANLWRHFLEIECGKRDQLLLFEPLFSEDGAIRTRDNGYQKNMCRKCFYLFEKVEKLHQVNSFNADI